MKKEHWITKNCYFVSEVNQLYEICVTYSAAWTVHPCIQSNQWICSGECLLFYFMSCYQWRSTVLLIMWIIETETYQYVGIIVVESCFITIIICITVIAVGCKSSYMLIIIDVNQTYHIFPVIGISAQESHITDENIILLCWPLYMPRSDPSVRLSVLRHIPVFCRYEWSYNHAVFTVG